MVSNDLPTVSEDEFKGKVLTKRARAISGVDDDDNETTEAERIKRQKNASGVDEEKSSPKTPSPKNTGHSDPLQFSPPSGSTLTEHSLHTRTSPSSIRSKPCIKYDAVDASGSQYLSAGNFNGKEHRIEHGSMALIEAGHLSELSKTVTIYETIRGHKERIVKWLKDLSSFSFEACEDKIESAVKPTINVAIEMTDAASLSKLVNSSAEKIEGAQKQALSAAMFLLEAENFLNQAQQLLLESPNSLEHTLE